MSASLDTNPQNQRMPIETFIGLFVVVGFIAFIVICSWLRYTTHSVSVPLHIQNAPVARHVGPEYYLSPHEQNDSRMMARLEQLRSQSTIAGAPKRIELVTPETSTDSTTTAASRRSLPNPFDMPVVRSTPVKSRLNTSCLTTPPSNRAINPHATNPKT